jgi:Flp pilus assembly protein TadD
VLGQVYATTGRQQEGIAHLKKAIEIAPNNAEAPRQLAQILADLGRLEEAEKSYIASTKARPTDWFGYLLLGIFYNRQQRWSEAENAYRKAQTLAPGNEVIYRNLGVLYAEQGRYPEAEKALQEGLRANPKSPSTFSTLASVLFVSHHFQEAVNAMEAAIELDPRKPYFWGNLGIYSKWAPGNEGKSAEALRKAVEMMEKGLEAIPDDFSSRANLAEYRARLGESDRALAELNKIPETARRPVATRFIIVYELVGRRAAAIAATKEYITTPEAMRQIRDDPDLARLWEDKAFQTAIPRRLLAFQH